MSNGILETAMWGVSGYLFLAYGFVALYAVNTRQSTETVSGDASGIWGVIAATIGPALVTLGIHALRKGRIRPHVLWDIVACVAAVIAFFGGVLWLQDPGDFPFFGLPLVVFAGLTVLSVYRLAKEAS